jgi:hypothetical protein
MFRRRLKKEKSKYRFKLFLLVLILVSILIVAVEYLYLNVSFSKNRFISPIAAENKSKLIGLENSLDKKQILYTSVNVDSDDSFTVTLKNGGEIILSSKKDIGSQLASLQLILSRLTIEGKILKKLDFRYDNPVISF